MSYLRAHPGRAIITAVLVVIAATLAIVIPVSSSDDAPARVDASPRDIRIGGALTATMPGALPPSSSAREGAGRYAAAMVQLANRARDRGIQAPSKERVAVQLAAWARACCDGDVASLITRAKKQGASRADVEAAATTMILAWELPDALAQEISPPDDTAIDREIKSNPDIYTQGVIAQPIVEVRCPVIACARAAQRLLDDGVAPRAIQDQLRERWNETTVDGRASTGPAALNSMLWRQLSARPQGAVSDSAVRLPDGAWAVARVKGPPRRGVAPPESAVREMASMAIRRAEASERVASDVAAMTGIAEGRAER